MFLPFIQLKYTEGPVCRNPELCPSKELESSCSRDLTKKGRRMFAALEKALCHSVMWRLGEGHIW